MREFFPRYYSINYSTMFMLYSVFVSVYGLYNGALISLFPALWGWDWVVCQGRYLVSVRPLEGPMVLVNRFVLVDTLVSTERSCRIEGSMVRRDRFDRLATLFISWLRLCSESPLRSSVIRRVML